MARYKLPWPTLAILLSSACFVALDPSILKHGMVLVRSTFQYTCSAAIRLRRDMMTIINVSTIIMHRLWLGCRAGLLSCLRYWSHLFGYSTAIRFYRGSLP